MNRWIRGPSNRCRDADLRFNLLEQKVEELYHALNKVQDDHDKLASVIEEIACEILSEVATMGDSGTGTSSQYFSCKSDMRDTEEQFLKSGDISELPGTEELLGRETPSDQLDGYPIPNRPFRDIGRRTTPPPIPAKSSKRFVPLSPENPFLDTPGPRRSPHRFTSEFGKGSSRPTSPIPYIPPPRPPPHGSLSLAPGLNSNQPISACAYFAPAEKKGPSAPRQQQEANERRDGHAWTSSSTRSDNRHGGEVRYRRPTGWQVGSSANNERQPGHFDATLYADDVEGGRLHGRHVGPGGFGTGDEALDALEWDYSPARGWTSRQPSSWSGADFAGADVDPSTPAQGQRAHFDGRHWSLAQGDCGSSSSSSEDSASDGSGESDGSDETVRPVRSGETEQGGDERALHGQRESPETRRLTTHHYRFVVPESYIPSTGRDNNQGNTHPQPGHLARHSSLHEQQHLLVASHEVLGLAALILLNFDENDWFPRGVNPVVRHRQGSILWARFLWQPGPHREELMWMHRRQLEDNIVWYIQSYCNTGDRALNVDLPTCEQQARAIVSALFRKARQSPRGRVTLHDLWWSYRHRFSMPSH